MQQYLSWATACHVTQMKKNSGHQLCSSIAFPSSSFIAPCLPVSPLSSRFLPSSSLLPLPSLLLLPHESPRCRFTWRWSSRLRQRGSWSSSLTLTSLRSVSSAKPGHCLLGLPDCSKTIVGSCGFPFNRKFSPAKFASVRDKTRSFVPCSLYFCYRFISSLANKVLKL